MMPRLYSFRVQMIFYLGKIGIAGLALVIFAALHDAFILMPLHARSLQLHEELAELRLSAGHSPVALDAGQAGAERAKSFREFFPEPRDANYWLGKLYAISEREKLQLPHGDYRTGESNDRFPRQMKISLPVRGNYAQIRRFAMGALADIPFLSLDEVSFQRSDAGSASLEAQVGFTFFFGRNP